MDKKSIRSDLLAKRNRLSPEYKKKQSLLITKKVLNLQITLKSNNILIYMPVGGEVNTIYLIKKLKELGKNIFLSAFKKKDYVICRFESFDELETGPYSIPQPTRVLSVDVNILDLAIVPGVAYDQKGVRLGYGKGIYDHLLRNFKGVKIGLAFDFQVINNIPKEKHDLNVDFVVSQKKNYNCG